MSSAGWEVSTGQWSPARSATLGSCSAAAGSECLLCLGHWKFFRLYHCSIIPTSYRTVANLTTLLIFSLATTKTKQRRSLFSFRSNYTVGFEWNLDAIKFSPWWTTLKLPRCHPTSDIDDHAYNKISLFAIGKNWHNSIRALGTFRSVDSSTLTSDTGRSRSKPVCYCNIFRQSW